MSDGVMVWECRNDGDTTCSNQKEADELDRIWPSTAPHADCGPAEGGGEVTGE